jgi:hypothetical protein
MPISHAAVPMQLCTSRCRPTRQHQSRFAEPLISMQQAWQRWTSTLDCPHISICKIYLHCKAAGGGGVAVQKGVVGHGKSHDHTCPITFSCFSDMLTPAAPLQLLSSCRLNTPLSPYSSFAAIKLNTCSPTSGYWRLVYPAHSWPHVP